MNQKKTEIDDKKEADWMKFTSQEKMNDVLFKLVIVLGIALIIVGVVVTYKVVIK